MRVLILIDAKNFEQGVIDISRKREEFRYIDFYKLNNFVIDYLKKNLQYKDCQLTHLRTYFYTGEYTDKLIDKIERYLEKNSEKKDIIRGLLDKCKKEQEKQNIFFNYAKNYYFFEIKSKPLQFSYSDIKVLQKGVDVQLAVDLVDFTHKDMFDIAVIFSGDIDLLESIKTAKGMGKQIIIMGNSSVTAEEMKRQADLFIDVGRFDEEQLNKFTHIYNREDKN
jgi:uncharacterized LabA/DUF88 family protein